MKKNSIIIYRRKREWCFITRTFEAVENEDLITINTGKNSTAYKVFDLDELQKDPLKMKLTRCSNQ